MSGIPNPNPMMLLPLLGFLQLKPLRAPIKWIPLFHLAPEEIWDRFEENAREKVCLRIFESLFAQSKGVTCSVSPNPDSKVVFDPSESRVNVFRQILLKVLGHAMLALILWSRVKSVDMESKAAITTFDTFIWKGLWMIIFYSFRKYEMRATQL